MAECLRLVALLCLPIGLAAAQSNVRRVDADAFTRERSQMVERDIVARGIRDARVLESMRRTPRHLFVPAARAAEAYEDRPLPIGQGQTISQPYVVALMTELARPTRTDRALEVGTGSGYQAAVLAPLVARVYTIELLPELAARAEARLAELGHANVVVRAGDGYAGWPEQAPFDVILVTAAPNDVPAPLLEQLAPGGRLVIPVGSRFGIQELKLIEKARDGSTRTTNVAPVRFVPLERAR